MLVVSPHDLYGSRFTFTVKTDNPGTSNSNQFTLPTVAGLTYDYRINWGDGTVENITTDESQTHTYATAGTYEIQIHGTFPRIYFDKNGDVDKVTKITDLGRVGWSNMERAFYGASNITEVVRVGDTSNVANFLVAWRDCTSLTSFPLINTSSGTILQATWFNCSALTSFPLIDTSSVTNFLNAWRNCSALTSFPLIDASSATTFWTTWLDCSSLTDFPANFFDTWVGVPDNKCFNSTWDGCSALTAQSVENILVSIDASGVNAPGGATAGDNYIDIDYNVATGALSVATNTAITNLKNKGWEPFINGVLV